MDKSELIKQLELAPHSEGGYFRRTYTAPFTHETNGERRPFMSSIYYLLTDDSPIGHWHCNNSDIMHYWHGGAPIRYWLLADNSLHSVTLGPNLADGEQLQLLVSAGTWKASELLAGSDYGLISEAVTPAFDELARQLPATSDLLAQFPAHRDIIERLALPDTGTHP